MNNKSPISDINSELLHKFFHQKCKSEEKEIVIQCLSDPGSEKKLKYVIRDQWNDIKSVPPGNDVDVDGDRLLSKIHQQIHMNEWMKSQSRSWTRKIYGGFSKIAATLLIPLLVYSGWNLIKNSDLFRAQEKVAFAEIHSPLGARTHFELPDGSTGWLNSGSTLYFPHQFRGQKRKVRLSGEGYFEIETNPKKPFVVQAGEFEVIALGTRFNVKNYGNDVTTDITLNEGKVLVNRILQDGNVSRISELNPDQQLIINNNTLSVQKRKVEADRISSWTNGMLSFRDEPMVDVIKKIERWYNVEIILKDQELENYKYWATFVDETLDEVLKLIKLTSPVDYSVSERVKLPDGSFSKKSITLFIKPGYKRPTQ